MAKSKSNATARNAQRALAQKKKQAPPQRPATETADDGIQAANENLDAQREDSVEIGGLPEALGRSHGVRKSDQS